MPNRVSTCFLAAALLAALPLVSGCANVRDAVRNIHNVDLIGKPAPELVGGEWIGSGQAIPASAKFDQWTVIAFFRPWDTACGDDVPEIVRLQSGYAHRGLRVFGVTEAPAERALEFVERYGVPYPVLTDAQASEDAYQVELLWGSAVFLVDPGGIVVAEKLSEAERILRRTFGEPRERW